MEILECWELNIYLKQAPSYTVGGKANQYSRYGEQCGDSLKNEIELRYDPEIPLLGIHTKETRIERDTCTPMFIATYSFLLHTFKYVVNWEQV